MNVRYEWRGVFTNLELNRLHAEGFDHRVLDDDWVAQVERHSLGWVTARDGDLLVGFVNVAWDGAIHAFILDTLVAATHLRHGIATELVGVTTDQARSAGCEWLHELYFGACGFTPTNAGLIPL